MSAEILRRAARLMRERAEAATPGPWGQVINDKFGPQASVYTPVSNLTIGEYANAGEYRGAENALHIASWHPAVALAVADWLDETADHLDVDTNQYADGSVCLTAQVGPECSVISQAITVARAYLGEA